MISTTLRFLFRHPLAGKHRSRALSRWVAWQLWSRVVRRPRVVPFVGSSRLRIAPGMTGATGNLYAGLHDFEDMGFVLHALRATDVFLDVGANVGSYTVLAGKVVGARCESFEPVPSTFEHLKANVALNGITERVTLHAAGVGSVTSTLCFSTTQDATNHVVQQGPGLEVPVVTLDDTVRVTGPAILKIDVEGWETEALAGATSLLSADAPRALILELNGSGARYGFDDARLHESLMASGYETFTYEPFSRTLHSLNGQIDGVGNTIYLKQADFFKERVRTAPAFEVMHERV